MQLVQPTPTMQVLDVGVTSDRREDCNFFERYYPYPQSITAVGMEDAKFLEKEFPGLTYVQADGLNLPFPDKSFDLVVSSAVIEHVGDRQRQQAFVNELCRVGKRCFITTPNRWYPVEFHTILPLIHWLPATWFRRILRLLGHDFWAREENLNLLTAQELQQMCPPTMQVYMRPHRLLGLVSNIVFYAVDANSVKHI
ncbi:class I SAM-dependent methyltransferase [Leptolyngbya sp. FACHB-8]|nr:class I SAM-dependent methyltransferase [Leptolyngbya sp. FACHB-8]